MGENFRAMDVARPAKGSAHGCGKGRGTPWMLPLDPEPPVITGLAPFGRPSVLANYPEDIEEDHPADANMSVGTHSKEMAVPLASGPGNDGRDRWYDLLVEETSTVQHVGYIDANCA